mgnify:CR=1 FL=1
MKKLIISSLIFFSLVITGFSQQEDVDQFMKDYSEFFRMMNDNFVDEIQLEDFVVKIKKMTIHQLDPHSQFYTKEETETRNKGWRGISYAGIGAIVKQSEKGVVIDYCKKGYGAEKSGLLPGDLFAKVDSVECLGASLQKVINLLRGENGTVFKVTVQRGDAFVEKEIKRQNIISKSISFSDTISKDVGLIKVDKFLRGSGATFRENVQQLMDDGATKIILDFRGNIGGLIVESVNFLSAFLEKGTAAYDLKSNDPKCNYSDRTKQEPLSTKIPIVILIDHNTISSGEIFTGAIQDFDRGVLIGQKTHGKGLVQGTRYFEDGASLYITSARYHLPSGRCIQKTDYRKNYSNVKSSNVKKDTNVFRSKNGRVFQSGDGISPDKHLKISTPKSELVKSIEKSNLTFQFAVDVRRKYGEELFSNWNEIEKDWIEFILSNRSQLILTMEKQIEEMELASKNDPEMLKKLNKISKKLDKQKKMKINKEKESIAEILYEKLILYDKYKEGLYKYKANKDPWVKKAIEILNSKEEYDQILKDI